MLDISLLLVEDDEFLRKQLVKSLKEIVRELYIARDGKEGLETFREYRPDIIVTDLNMPELDGVEMSKLIREYNVTTPIIVLTALDDKEVILNALNNGRINLFLNKPVSLKDLIEAIEKLIEEQFKNRGVINSNIAISQSEKDNLLDDLDLD